MELVRWYLESKNGSRVEGRRREQVLKFADERLFTYSQDKGRVVERLDADGKPATVVIGCELFEPEIDDDLKHTRGCKKWNGQPLPPPEVFRGKVVVFGKDSYQTELVPVKDEKVPSSK